MQWIFFYLLILGLWFGFVGLMALWIVKRVIPSIVKEMNDYGLNEIQQKMLLNKAVFPPKFHK